MIKNHGNKFANFFRFILLHIKIKWFTASSSKIYRLSVSSKSGQNIDLDASLFFRNMDEYAHCLTGSPFVFNIFREIEPNATSTSVGLSELDFHSPLTSSLEYPAKLS